MVWEEKSIQQISDKGEPVAHGSQIAHDDMIATGLFDHVGD